MLLSLLIASSTLIVAQPVILEGWKQGKKYELIARKVPLKDRNGGPVYLREDAAEDFMYMMSEAATRGFFIDVNYAWRSYNAQRALWRHFTKRGITNRAATPGWSTHQSGLSVDISGCYKDIKNKRYKTMLYWWLHANGKYFGFYNDIAHEPWHWTYYPDRIEQR
jgi:LAS superfamily LD-carboxypeptidase LdcB